MSIRSTLAIARKDALDIILNKSTLLLMLTPLILAVIFVGIDVLLGSHTTNALIYDPGKSNVEQVIDKAFSDIKVTYVNSPDAVTAAFGSRWLKQKRIICYRADRARWVRCQSASW